MLLKQLCLIASVALLLSTTCVLHVVASDDDAANTTSTTIASTTAEPSTTSTTLAPTTTATSPATPPPSPTVPTNDVIYFNITFQNSIAGDADQKASAIAAATGGGCEADNVRLAVDANDARKAVLHFVGSAAALYGHRFLAALSESSGHTASTLGVVSFTYRGMVPPTTVPAGDSMVFVLLLTHAATPDTTAKSVAVAVAHGCTANDVRVVVDAADARNVTVNFIGHNAAVFSHHFLYDVLFVNASSVSVVKYTYSVVTAPPGEGPGPSNTKKIAIAASVVGGVVLIVLACGLKSGKCKKCCSKEGEGEVDNNKTYRTPQGAEMTYTHDDLEQYRKIR